MPGWQDSADPAGAPPGAWRDPAAGCPARKAGQAFSAVAAGLPSASTPSTRCAKTLAESISNAMVPQTGNAGIRLMAGGLVAGVAA